MLRRSVNIRPIFFWPLKTQLSIRLVTICLKGWPLTIGCLSAWHLSCICLSTDKLLQIQIFVCYKWHICWSTNQLTLPRSFCSVFNGQKKVGHISLSICNQPYVQILLLPHSVNLHIVSVHDGISEDQNINMNNVMDRLYNYEW